MENCVGFDKMQELFYVAKYTLSIINLFYNRWFNFLYINYKWSMKFIVS